MYCLNPGTGQVLKSYWRYPIPRRCWPLSDHAPPCLINHFGNQWGMDPTLSHAAHIFPQDNRGLCPLRCSSPRFSLVRRLANSAWWTILFAVCHGDQGAELTSWPDDAWHCAVPVCLLLDIEKRRRSFAWGRRGSQAMSLKWPSLRFFVTFLDICSTIFNICDLCDIQQYGCMHNVSANVYVYLYDFICSYV